jgi:hypothetical protein
MDKLLRYEREKKRLQALNLSPKKYEEEIRKLAKRLKV